jgi:hypothetical protein
MSVTRWKFEDYHQTGPTPYTYTWEINPSDGGSPSIQKNMTSLTNTGPNRMILAQEGQSTVPALTFAGVILTQTHYETLELWFNRRVLIKLTDDLSRVFYGVFTAFNPKRVRRGANFWYHTFDAEFQCNAYYNASGERVYGRLPSA